MPAKRFHLFWFHHAGGSSTFYLDWLHRYQQGENLPLWLGLSAIRSPELKSKTQYHQLNDKNLHYQMKDAFPPKLTKYPEVLNMLLKILRHDLLLAETAITMSALSLPIPISLFYAEADEIVSFNELIGWKKHTQFPVIWHKFNGNHMYLEKQKTTMCQRIIEDINYILYEKIKA